MLVDAMAIVLADVDAELDGVEEPVSDAELRYDEATQKFWLTRATTHECVELIPPPLGQVWSLETAPSGMQYIESEDESHWFPTS